MELRNESGLAFTDISTEAYRVYDFGFDGNVRIDNPVALNVSKAGGHRVLDSQGVSHYIAPRWRHLYWEAKPGAPHFVK